MNTKAQKLSLSGILLAVGIILPFAASHGLGVAGTVLLPMHIPVLICGFLCGPLYGGILGLVLPVLNSVLTGMPSFYPMMPIMTAELFIYGLTTGLFYNKTPLKKYKLGIYPALIGAMLCGRIAYAFIFELLLFTGGKPKAATVFIAAATGLPGIIIQLLLVPAVVKTIEHYFHKSHKNAVLSAKNLIMQETAACVVIKNDTIIRTEYGRGVGPIIKLYDEGVLDGAFVVDKIIGKAGAMVLSLGNIKGCYGLTVSDTAEEWLKSHNISIEYEQKVPIIINRNGDNMCPMEETVKNIENSKEALEALRNKISELSGGIKNDL